MQSKKNIQCSQKFEHVFLNILWSRRRRITFHYIAIAVNKKLGEVPSDVIIIFICRANLLEHLGSALSLVADILLGWSLLFEIGK